MRAASSLALLMLGSLVAERAPGAFIEAPLKTSPITMSITSQGGEVVFGAPVPVRMTISNRSARTVMVMLDYRGALGVRFTVERGAGARDRPRRAPSSVLTWSTPVPARSDYAVTWYVGRFVEFQQPGTYEVRYDVRLPYYFVDADGTREAENTLHASGTIRVQLARGDDEALRKELAGVAEGLNSKKKQKRIEASVALCYLDHPIAEDFIVRVLSAESSVSRMMALRALVRFGTRAGHKAVATALAQESDPAVVKAALDAVTEADTPLDPDTLKGLLSSDRDGVRYHAVGYLARVGDPTHIPLLRPLLQDPARAVARRAQQAIAALREKP